MSEKKVKFGVIGASWMGMRHMESIVSHPNMELVAICDKNEEALKEAGRLLDVSALTVDWHDIISNPEVEAVLVCMPDYLHEEMTVAALNAGKHVICEKPMALTLEECERMRDASKKHPNQKFMVGQICRHAPGFKLAKELIDRGEIGELYFVESEYAHDYSYARGADDWRVDPRREPFIGGGCHAVDLLRWIAGDPYEITAYSNHKCLTDWPVNDCTISILKFPNDVLGKVFVSIGCKRTYTMRSVFYGTKGTIICDNTSPTITVCKTGLTEKDSIFSDSVDSMLTPIQLPVQVRDHNTYQELSDFVEAIIENKPVPTSAYDGEKSVAVCMAAMESSKSGKPVSIYYPAE